MVHSPVLVNSYSGQHVTFGPEALTQAQTITVELMTADDGQKMIEQRGGRMSVGHGYASNFIIVNPHSLKTSDKFVIGMKVDSEATSKIQFYRSSDALDLKTWYKVDSSMDDGLATLEVREGMKRCFLLAFEKQLGYVILCLSILRWCLCGSYASRQRNHFRHSGHMSRYRDCDWWNNILLQTSS